MPEKKDSKIMSMLERTGVIRKADSDGSLDIDSGAGSDIKPIFDAPDDVVNVKQAARQPIPGMPSPVFPSDKSEDVSDEQLQEEVSAYLDADDEVVEEAPEVYAEEPQPVSFDPPQPEAQPEVPPRPAQPFGGLNIFRNGNDNVPDEAPGAASVTMERDSQPENYTDRFLNTEELYDALALRSKKTDSIYLIEEYLKTLPDSLPDAQRRDIVKRLISTSGFDYDLLMGDGVLRVKMLKEYAERFARHTDDYIADRQAELDEYDQQILRTRRLIENRKDLHKKQFFSIEAEAQRLKEILTFISG